MRTLHLSIYTHKRASVDPQILAALQGALVGGAGGAAIQGIRKLMRGRHDDEEDSPSILKGMLMGGGLGAAGGLGLEYLMRTPQQEPIGFTAPQLKAPQHARPSGYSNMLRASLPPSDAGTRPAGSQLGSLEGLNEPRHPALM